MKHATAFALGLWLSITLAAGVSSQQLPISRDWYERWQTLENNNTINLALQRFPQWVPTTRWDVAQRFQYEPSQFIIPAYIYASQVPSIPLVDRTGYRDMTRNYFDYMFGTVDPDDYYIDVPDNIAAQPNGLDDGFRGWANARFTSNWVIPTPIVQSAWYNVRVLVTDNGAGGTGRRTRVRVWVWQPPNTPPATPVYDEWYNPWRSTRLQNSGQDVANERFPFGTIALLSGWSDTRFADLEVHDITDPMNPVLRYTAVARSATFFSDWRPVVDTTLPADENITADFIHTNW